MQEKRIEYIFIGGLFGGLLRKSYVFDYFKDMETYLSANYQNIDTKYLQNPFTRTIDDGAKMIAYHVKETLITSTKDVVLVGHSKGSLELLEFIFQYPELSNNKRIRKFVFSSPLFGKSHLGELKLKYLSKLMPKKLVKSLEEASDENLSYIVQKTWEEIQNRKSFVTERSVIIKTASSSLNHYPTFLKISSKILNRIAGENDGVLALSSQKSLPGVQEARFYSNHGAIFCNNKINRANQVNIHDVFSFIDFEPTPEKEFENILVLNNYRKNKYYEELR